MNKDTLISEKIKDLKLREYFNRLLETIERQNKEIHRDKIIIQILRLNYRQDIKQFLKELLFLFGEDQYNSIRIIIKNQNLLIRNNTVKVGIGENYEAYAYLDEQVENLLGKPGIMYIDDTTKIHSIKFSPGKQFPKTILGVSLGKDTNNLGLIWFACENQRDFSKVESDLLIAQVEAFTSAIQNCVEWEENLFYRSVRDEIANLLSIPVFILSRDKIIFSNHFAQQNLNMRFEKNNGAEGFIKNIWDLQNNYNNLISIDDLNYEVKISEIIQNFQEPVRVAILFDETITNQQRKYISLIIETISQGLRSPLNLVLGSIKMIPLVGEVNSSQQNYLDKIQQETEYSLDMVEELLDIDRIIKTNGLIIKTVSINNLIKNSIALIGHFAKQKRIAVMNKYSKFDELINVDEVLFTQAIANILEFSIGQTALGGEVELNAENQLEKIVLIIKDNSRGLSQVEVDRLNSFERLHEVPKNLLLVHSIINFHRGTFEIQSILGRGTTYIIGIPK